QRAGQSRGPAQGWQGAQPSPQPSQTGNPAQLLPPSLTAPLAGAQGTAGADALRSQPTGYGFSSYTAFAPTAYGTMSGRLVMSVQPEGMGMVTVSLTRVGGEVELAIAANQNVTDAIMRDPADFVSVIRDVLPSTSDVAIRIVPQADASAVQTQNQNSASPARGDAAPQFGRGDNRQPTPQGGGQPERIDGGAIETAAVSATITRIMV
ncbi:MAG: hypothetical protein HC779_07165, partial [Phyllobacteriaceae bacterium]|nr:hypothetical protein [Phyllobacteriaceae bacterium]